MGRLNISLTLLLFSCWLTWSYQTAAQLQVVPQVQATAEGELVHIHQLMAQTWHNEQQPLRFGPAVLQRDIAIADWWWQGKGGRAVLRKVAAQWKIVFCGGAGVKKPELFTGLGLAEAEAILLLQQLQQAEAQLSAAELQLLDSFGATVRLDGHHAAQ